jgi:hypothetical protein
MKEVESKKPGYQRLRIMQYDELRRKLTSSHGLTVSREAVSGLLSYCLSPLKRLTEPAACRTRAESHRHQPEQPTATNATTNRQVIGDDTLTGFRKREDDEDGGSASSSSPSYTRPTTASRAGGGSRGPSPSPSKGGPASPREAAYGGRKSRPATATARIGASADGSSPPKARAAAAPGRGASASVELLSTGATGASGDDSFDADECEALAAGDTGAQTDDWEAPSPAAAGATAGAATAALAALELSADDMAAAKVRALKAATAVMDEGVQTSPKGGADAGADLIKAWRCEAGAHADLPDNAGREQQRAAAAEQQQQQAVDAQQQPSAEAAAEAEARAAALDVGGRGFSSGAGSSVSAQQEGGTFSPFVQLEFKPRPESEESIGAASDAGEAATATAAAPAIPAVAPPKLLARFRVNKVDSMAVFMATTAEDFRDVVGLLPANSALPASDKMSYLLGRLEVNCGGPGGLARALARVVQGEATMGEAVGPAVGCLMATIGTSLITDCIFDFEDPEELEGAGQEQRLELWGLQVGGRGGGGSWRLHGRLLACVLPGSRRERTNNQLAKQNATPKTPKNLPIADPPQPLGAPAADAAPRRRRRGRSLLIPLHRRPVPVLFLSDDGQRPPDGRRRRRRPAVGVRRPPQRVGRPALRALRRRAGRRRARGLLRAAPAAAEAVATGGREDAAGAGAGEADLSADGA